MEDGLASASAVAHRLYEQNMTPSGTPLDMVSRFWRRRRKNRRLAAGANSSRLSAQRCRDETLSVLTSARVFGQQLLVPRLEAHHAMTKRKTESKHRRNTEADGLINE